MFFLLRCAFWIALVLLILPIDTGEDGKESAGINPVTAFFAAQSTISDLSGFCERNPQTCETGGQAISQISAKAKVSARMIYEYLDENGELTTGATGTLTATDLEPVWALPKGEPATTAEAPSAPATPAAAEATAGQRSAQVAPIPAPGHGPVPLPRPKGADRPV
ncbi:DUF5330 domain-containing protein [Stappia indica]|uniref:DUF5330 domain-containing protein n=1 Tax=Stappia indica TaxID=538381 RepID=A0A857CD23_9HYPH|nr:DUF5330 domain-containing protein [Stappia indica]QGZ36789.1 hypothetical protein GH266_21205 [Stappia indica]